MREAIYIDKDLQREARELYAGLGLSLENAITVFLKQSIYEWGIPFRVGRDAFNKETLEALKEQDLESFNSVEALFDDLKS